MRRSLDEKALQLDPHDLRSRQLLMLVLTQVGDTAGAEKQRPLLEETKAARDRLTQLHARVLARAWDDQLRLEIAELCLKLNRTAEAQTWLRAAVVCNPGNARARQLLEQTVAAAGSPPAPRAP